MSLKEKLLSGQRVYGSMVRLQKNPAISFLAKNAGLDFLPYDCEHSHYNFETLHDIFVTGNAMGFDSFVRVAQLSKDWISRILDSGATGIMVPMTETGEQAKEIVNWAKFAPIGDRGYGSGLAHSNYASGGKHVDVMAAQNNRVVVIAQIETELGVNNADAIAATEGIDVLLIGPNDLSISLGIPGDLLNQKELDAIAKVAAACKKHGKSFGLHAGAPMHEHFKADENFMMLSTDMDILANGFKNIKETLAKIG